jgi:hypothetical protein
VLLVLRTKSEKILKFKHQNGVRTIYHGFFKSLCVRLLRQTLFVNLLIVGNLKPTSIMRKFLFYFALTGYLLGLIVHLLSLADIDILSNFPFIWLLHLGIFVVWIPTIFEIRKRQQLEQKHSLTKNNPLSFFKVMFSRTPKWLTIVAIVGFIYAIINFSLAFLSQTGTPDIKDGQYILQNHGQLIRIITEQEYHHDQANEARGFSGHWIAFYGIALAVLFPFGKLTEKEKLPQHKYL